MIVVTVKEGENIERALKKFKRKFEKTGVVKELRARQQFDKPSVLKRLKKEHAVYVQKLPRNKKIGQFLVFLFYLNYIRCRKIFRQRIMFIDHFIDYLRVERKYSVHTLRSYSKDLRQFEEYLGSLGENIGLNEADSDIIRTWIAMLMEQGLAPTTVNRKMSALRSFYLYLQ